jgi:DNA-directed RNA polymerase specialized sigma24 family protein
MTGKEYMNQIREIRREIRLLEEQILRDTVFASNVKAIRYDVDKVQTSPDGDRMADIISGIVGAEDKLYKKVTDLMQKEEEARQYLIQLREEYERVLVLHYFEGLKWEDVADKIGYDDKYIYDVKNRALDALTQLLTKSDEI